jgi:hypothetical protein
MKSGDGRETYSAVRCCQGDIECSLQVVELEDHDEASTRGEPRFPESET